MINNHQNRMNHKWLLAWKWIVVHRPDVADLIEEEAEQAFPKKMKLSTTVELPKSLQKLK